MRFRTKSSKVILCLFCVLVCLNLVACNSDAGGENDDFQATNSSTEDASSKNTISDNASAENTTSDSPSSDSTSTENASSENTPSDLPAKEAALSLSEEITMELFGLDLFQVNRPIWEERIFTLKEPEEYTTVYLSFSIGDYEVMHSRKNFQNMGNFSSFIHYRDVMNGAQILFDENDNLSMVFIEADLGKEFDTSFINIGDNPREYLEALKPGVWDKLLAGERLFTTQGWCMYYYTTSDNANGVLQVSARDILLTYFLKDEFVDNIMLTVIGEPPQKAESSIYDLDRFDYYLAGKDIAKMSAGEWLEFFDFDENVVEEAKLKALWMNILDFSKERYYTYECDKSMADRNAEARFTYGEQPGSKWMNLSLYPMGGDGIKDGCTICFWISQEGSIQIDLGIDGKFPIMASNFIMPGENIRTFLNSYEDGLYEKIVAMDSDINGYQTGPYHFWFESGADCDSLSIRKEDERMMSPVYFFLENEVVTRVSRMYNGIISGFDEELFLQ